MTKNSPQTNLPIWKVHITYNVHEHARIVDPILEECPNTLFYFHFDDGNRLDVHLDYRDKNLAVIRDKLPKCKIVERGINYVDYYQIISNLAGIINQENKDHPEHAVKFKINLGTGSKMVAIANVDASRLWENIEIIYPFSEMYDISAESTHSGTIQSADPPKFEFKHPNQKLKQAIQILYTLREKSDVHGHIHDFVKQRDLLHYIFDIFKVLEVSLNDDPRKYNTSQYMALNRNILDKLEKYWGFITRVKVGRDYHIFFTEKGEKMARVFVNYDYGIDLALLSD
ncbi:MAG: HFX_2341 family transcriptional regulator domain-containing protein [Promethearchaeota archaeon]